MSAEKRRRILTQARAIRNFHRHTRAGAKAVARAATTTLLTMALATSLAAAEGTPPLRLLVQLGELGPSVQAGAHARLAGWLSARLGRPVRADASRDALTHWTRVRVGSAHDVVVEEAHFVDYRVRRHGYRVIARARQDARFAVVVAPGTLVSGLDDLQARRIAVSSPPGLAALRVHQLFPDPARAPVLVVPPRADQAPRWVAEGRVAAAVVAASSAPLPAGLRPVIITDALPGPGVSVAPGVDAETRRALLRALVAMADDDDARDLVALLGHAGFQAASDSMYEGAHRLLRGTWGYR